MNRESFPGQPESPNTNPNRWQSLEQAPPFEERTQFDPPRQPEKSAETPNRERQERKLISAYLSNDLTVFSERDATVNDVARLQVYDDINTGKLDSSVQSHILQGIAVPFHGQKNPQNVFSDIAKSKQESRILASISGLGPNDYDKISVNDLDRGLDQYPTPIEFDNFESDFLKTVSERNSPAKVAEYQQSFANFRQHFYGKRQEYADAFKSLEDKAKAYDNDDTFFFSQDQGNPATNAATAQRYQAPTTPRIEPDPINLRAPAHNPNYHEDDSGAAYFSPEQRAAMGDPDAIRMMQDLQKQQESQPKKKGIFGRIFGKK